MAVLSLPYTTAAPLPYRPSISLFCPSCVTSKSKLEQNDVKTKSKTSKANEDSVAETQGCCLESTSELSVSIFDEFLLSDPSRRSAEIENSGRRVNKWKQRNSQKEGKQLDKTKEKETIQGKKNPTSVLDEFI